MKKIKIDEILVMYKINMITLEEAKLLLKEHLK